MRVSNFDIDIRSSSPSNNLIGDIETPPLGQETTCATNLNDVHFLRAHLKILNDPVVLQEYKLNKKRYFDMISIIPLAVTFYVSVATRYNWSHINDDGPFFLASYISLFIGTLIFSIYFISHLIIYYTPVQKCKQSWCRLSEYFLFSGFGGRVEDILCVNTILYVGFCLLARVYKGQCQNTTDIWESQG